MIPDGFGVCKLRHGYENECAPRDDGTSWCCALAFVHTTMIRLHHYVAASFIVAGVAHGWATHTVKARGEGLTTELVLDEVFGSAFGVLVRACLRCVFHPAEATTSERLWECVCVCVCACVFV